LSTGTFSHTFQTPGTYPYYCQVHSFPGGTAMNGAVVVQGGVPTPTSTPIPATSTPVPPTSTPSESATPVAPGSPIPTLDGRGRTRRPRGGRAFRHRDGTCPGGSDVGRPPFGRRLLRVPSSRRACGRPRGGRRSALPGRGEFRFRGRSRPRPSRRYQRQPVE